jgi:hypothetical protein
MGIWRVLSYVPWIRFGGWSFESTFEVSYSRVYVVDWRGREWWTPIVMLGAPAIVRG